MFVKIKCSNCKKQFEKNEFEIRRTKNHFCSRKCSNEYQKNGKNIKCSNCGELFYRSESEIKNNKTNNFFCSIDCSIKHKTFLNKKFCVDCNKKMDIKTKANCCISCLKEKKNKEIKEWVNGEAKLDLLKNSTLKRKIKTLLLKEQNNKCKICGIKDEWNKMPLIFVLDHIDGHSENNLKSNLRLICSNCDSQLVTYKSKNIGNGRIYNKKYMNENKRDV